MGNFLKSRSARVTLYSFLIGIVFCLIFVAYFVLAEETTPPTVHILWPDNYFNFSSAHVSFDWNISDDVQIENLTRYIWNSSNDFVDANSTELSGTFNQSDDTAYFFEYELPYPDIYQWNLYGCDNSSNCAWSDEGNYSFNYTESGQSPVNISVVKYADNETVNCSSEIQFIINVTNNNDYNLTNITINDTIGESTGLFFQSSSPVYTNFSSGNYVYWTISNLEPDETQTIYANFTSGGSGNFTNTVQVLNETDWLMNASGNVTVFGECEGGDMGGQNLTVNLTSPSDGYTFTSSPFFFAYNVTGNGPANCSLWGNFTGEWQENQTNIIAFMDENNFTINNLSDGTYLWNVMCTNGMNESWGASNQTFSVDTSVQMNISVVKYLENDTVNCTSQMQFIINVTNNNDYNLTNITVNDSVGESIGLYFQNSLPMYTNISWGNSVYWTISNLEPDATYTIYANFTASSTGNFTNTVMVSNETQWLMNASGNVTVFGICDYGGEGNLTVNLTSPSDEYTFTSAPFTFNYTVTGSGMVFNCSLWGNFTGIWAENQTNTNVTMGGINNNFTIENLSDGAYIWNIKCLNGESTEFWAESNWTFSVGSSVYPSINFTSPTPENGTIVNVNSIKINTITNESDTDFKNYTYYLYNSTGLVTTNIYTKEDVGISAGAYHTCFLKQNGSVQCQGYNSYGESNPYYGTDVIQVSAGTDYTCFLKQNGSVQCQGVDELSDYGQANNYLDTDVIQVSAGKYHTCFLKQNGSVQCQGLNDDGQSNPYDETDVIQVSQGYYHTCFLKQNGSVQCRGDLSYNYSDTDVIQISAGDGFFCFLKQNGSVFCQGDNTYGQSNPYDGTDIIQISSGGDYVCFLKQNGSVSCQGYTDDGAANPYYGTDVIQVSSGGYHSCFLKQNGSVQCQGQNYSGESNPYNGNDIKKTPFYTFQNLADDTYYFNATVCNIGGNCGNTETRSVILSLPPNLTILSPQSIIYNTPNILINLTNSSDAQSVWFFNGTDNETYIEQVFREFQEGSSTLYAYANNSLGSLNTLTLTFSVDTISPSINFTSPTPENGTTLNVSVIKINTITNQDELNFKSYTYYLYNSTNLVTTNQYPKEEVGVFTGLYHTCFLKQNGSVSCQGDNGYGQSNNYSGTDIIQISSGDSYTCFLKQNGSVSCQGYNNSGSINPYYGTDVIQVSTGEGHTCFLKQNGSVQCQGSNDYGESNPYYGTDVIQISAGHYITCFLKQNGSVQCEGFNDYGQSNNYSGTDIIQVASGELHTCFLKQNGSVSCQGDNGYGQSNNYSGTDIIQVATGYSHTCFLKQNGSVQCQGSNDYGESNNYDGTDVKKTPFYTFQNLNNGTYYFNASACDSVGNCNSSETRNVTVGSVVSEEISLNLTIISPENKTYNTRTVDFNVSADKNLTFCKFTLDDWATNTTMTEFNTTHFTYTNSSIGDGGYTAKFWCNDINNNVNDTVEVMFSVNNSIISACRALTEAGTYTLNQSISAEGDCLVVQADNVVIDGAGFTITGNINANVAGAAAYTGMIVQNCVVNGSISASGADDAGGAGGSVTINDSTITTITTTGGYGYSGGGAGGSVTITNSTISTITTTGGMGDSGGGVGGAGGIVTITGSNITTITTTGEDKMQEEEEQEQREKAAQ